MNYFLKKTIICTLPFLLIAPVFSVDFSIDEIEYKPIEELNQAIRPTAISFEGETVWFDGKAVIKTNGLNSALEYIELQQQLSEIRRNSLKALLLSSAYTMQNADNNVALYKHAKTASLVAGCGYFGLDEELTFVIERSFTKLIDDSIERKNNLIAGSLQQSNYVPNSIDKKMLQDAVMSCAKNLDTWLIQN